MRFIITTLGLLLWTQKGDGVEALANFGGELRKKKSKKKVSEYIK